MAVRLCESLFCKIAPSAAMPVAIPTWRIRSQLGEMVELMPDVAVLDIEMPGIDGLQATELLREQVRHTAVLILTGMAQHGYLARALEAHVDGYLRKNAPSVELADAIRRVAKGQRFLGPP
jgi:two-component system, NarL family, response regulator DesR